MTELKARVEMLARWLGWTVEGALGRTLGQSWRPRPLATCDEIDLWFADQVLTRWVIDRGAVPTR